MTAAAHAARPSAQRPAAARWRQLAWVGWRQQRTTLAMTLVLLALVAVVLAVTGHVLYSAQARLGPEQWSTALEAGSYSWALRLLEALQVLPLVLGMFAGAPLLARQAEAGTFRFAWTQSAGRVRLLTAQVVPAAVILPVAAAALGLLVDWWVTPLIAGGLAGRWSEEAFALFPPAAAGWTLAGLTLGVLAGAVLRRTVAAMAATLAAYLVLAVLTAVSWRDHYLRPLLGAGTKAGTGTYVHGITNLTGAVTLGGYRGWPDGSPLSSHQLTLGQQWMDQHSIVGWVFYQPAGRFWPFEWIELGWLTAFALVLAAVIVVVVRRSAPQ